MSFIQQFFTSRDNNANAETFVGQEGRLWWDPVTNQIYSSDGSTPGGIPLAGGGGGNGSPGGSNSQVQFNQNGTFGGSANLTFDRTIGALTAVSFTGDGSALSNITGANVAGTVASAGTVTTAEQPNITSVGTLTSVSVIGNVDAGNINGNGSGLTALTGANVTGQVANALVAGTVYTAAQPNITSVGTLTSVTSTGNISGDYFIGNGSLLTGISASTYGNSNVSAYLASGTNTSNVITTGNVSGAFVIGNGSALTSITGPNVVGIVASANFAATANSATFANQATFAFGNGIIGQVPYAAVANSVSGSNVSGAVANAVYANTSANTTSINGGTAGALVVQNGAGATGFVTIAAANTILTSDGSSPAWTLPGSIAVGTVTTNAQPNITSVGTLSNVTVSGNITGGNINTAGAVRSTGSMTLVKSTGQQGEFTFTDGVGSGFVVGVGTELSTLAGAGSLNLVTSTSPGANIGFFVAQTERGRFTSSGLSVAGTISATGNVTGGNLLTGGLISATGNITSAANITGGNLRSNGQLDVAGNITGGNISIGGNFTTPGNIAASWVNGAFYTGNWGTNFLAIGNVSATGNVISTNAVYSNFNTNTANTASFNATGGNTKGGTGYLDFLVARNTSGGATNPYKWLRLNNVGSLEIINSAYSQNIFSLEDSGTLTIPGPLNIGGKQAVNGPAFSAYAAAILQTIPNNTQTKVLFQTEEFDTNSNYANSRFTPTVEGYYQLNAEVRLDGASGTGEMMIILYKNGAEYKRGTNQSGTQIASNFWAMQVSSIAYANGTGDYFEIYVQQGSGGNVTVTAVNNSAITWFNGCMLRGA